MDRVMTWAAVSVLVACAAAPYGKSVQFVGPDGSRDWWAIECAGDDALCWRQAGQSCPNGYQVQDKSQTLDRSLKTTVMGGQYVATAESMEHTITNGRMVVRCRGQSAAQVRVDEGCHGDVTRHLDCGPQLDAEREANRDYLPDAGH
jgi:hypothetical protein